MLCVTPKREQEIKLHCLATQSLPLEELVYKYFKVYQLKNLHAITE